jgi:iron complex outermembrane receptor protein
MRCKTLVRCSASFAALALSATSAWAQNDPPAQGATDPAATAAPEEDEGAIVVTGLRRSLQSAQSIRRNSDQIVDAVVAEDIGKLPDVTVSDTAARIPGIQVERSGGEASRVLVRGLDEEFYTTTYNGREIFTAETRSVALQDFPAGAIAAVEAFKTSSANLVEPGLAGLVNVRSRRPFDFDGFEIAGSVWATYPTQSEDLTPNANLLITNRWDGSGGEFGALINVSYTQLHYLDSVRRHGFFIAGLAGGRAPDWPETRYFEGNRWRPSVNGALQWRPSPGLEFYVEGLWQGYREEVSDRMWAQPLWGGTHSNIVFREGTNFVESGTVTNPAFPGVLWGFQGGTYRETNTYQFAAGGSYDAGALRITADVARTQSRFDLETESVDYEINTNQYAVDYVIGSPGGPGPTFRVRGIDPANPAIYTYRGFFEDYLTAKGDDWQARLDFEYETGMAFLPQLQWGARYVNRDASSVAGAYYWNLGGRNIPISSVPLDYQLFRPGFRGDGDRPFPDTWLAPTYDSIRGNLVALRQFNIARTGGGSVDGPPVDPTRTYAINEESLAGYVQARYEFDAGSVPIDGIIGLRAVRTRDRIDGTLGQLGGAAPIPVNLTNEYTDWLPSFNLRARLTPQLQLRLAATKTRTRPSFGQLNPALSLNQPPGCPVGQPGCFRTGSSGNPFLEPLDSTNYDASLDYYFSRAGFASVSVFRRDMTGFITNLGYQYPDADPVTGLPLIISRPVNTRQAKIQGFEAQISTFFDFEFMPNWARGFGAQANVTHLDATAEYLLFPGPLLTQPGPNTHFRTLPIPDVSRWSYNLVGMYEGGGLTLRLSYNWRNGFPEGDLSQRDGFYTLQGRGRPVSRLDWSSSYAVTDNLTVFFDWINILGRPFKSDIVRVNYANGAPTGTEVFPLVYRFEESIFSGGVRFRF